MVMLVKIGFELGNFSAPAETALRYFAESLNILFGWADPWLVLCLDLMIGWTGFDVNLQAHWRYIFSIIFLYVGAQAQYAWRQKLRGFAVFRVLWGGSAALIAAVAAGSLDLGDPVANFTIPFCTALGLALHQLGNNIWIHLIWRGDYERWWPGFRFSNYFPVYILALQTPVMLMGLFAPEIAVLKSLPSPALALLPFVFFFLAVFWILAGIVWASRETEPGSWWQRFKTENPTRLASLILQAIFGTILFLIANAGLSLAGL